MLEEFTFEEKRLISSLITRELSRLQRKALVYAVDLQKPSNEFVKEREQAILHDIDVNIEMCVDIIAKIRSKN